MNWFEELTGFREPDHATVRERVTVDGHDLVVRGSSRRYGIGELELVSLGELRERAVQPNGRPGRARVRIVKGDVRQMHRQPQYAGALFQVASQFNLLEMVSAEVTPEDGVTRYQHPCATAMPCAPSTVWGSSGGTCRRWTKRAATPCARSCASACTGAGGSHRPHRAATPEGVAGVLLGAARDVLAHSRPPLGALRAPRARSRLRGHLAGRGIASGARRHERRRAHAPGRRCVRQR